MTDTLQKSFLRDRDVWDSCASVYEQRIVGGHPDVCAYEEFEEDFLDRLLLHLVREHGRGVRLYDVGCGSGRLHLRYGLKTIDDKQLSEQDALRVRMLRSVRGDFAYDPLLSQSLINVGGLDFSEQMLRLAREKISQAGIGPLLDEQLCFEQGSAFELETMGDDPLPIVVSVCNSIGVMQGPEGAAELFRSVRRAVEGTGGIAFISGYHRDAVATHALGNYESTMDVCGQPRWLTPDTYADEQFVQIPLAYKRAYDPDATVTVNVLDADGDLVEKNYTLTRDSSLTQQTIETGHIQTHTDYQSHWYSYDQFTQWMETLWPSGKTVHIRCREIDALRGGPAQFAILDDGGLLGDLLKRWLI